MLLLIIGGVGSGKSAYAMKWARSLGRESIRFSCPPFPIDGNRLDYEEDSLSAGLAWKELAADSAMASSIDRINRESNVYLADRRVLVVDSLSGWFRAAIGHAKAAGQEPHALERPGEGTIRELLEALLAYQGKRIVVAEEPYCGLCHDPWERLYAVELARAVRILAEESHAVYRLTAGMASEVKGHRVKRGNQTDEHLYPNRR